LTLLLLTQGGVNENNYQFRIEGMEGTIKGCQGWHTFLGMLPDEVKVYSSRSPRQLQWLQIRLPYPIDPRVGRGRKVNYDLLSYPYAGFLGSMADLMQSIEQDRKPACNGEDNLKSLQIMFAAYKSAKERRPVGLSEIDS